MTSLSSILQPGDLILYAPSSLYGKLIAIKTWHSISHCELFTGNGQSAASRDGVGVGLYPLRTDHAAYVLRPQDAGVLDWVAFWKWFRTVNGQKYDWWGLLRFVWTHELGPNQHAKMYCSEFVVRAYRVMGSKAVSATEDADAFAPAPLLASSGLAVIATPKTLA